MKHSNNWFKTSLVTLLLILSNVLFTNQSNYACVWTEHIYERHYIRFFDANMLTDSLYHACNWEFNHRINGYKIDKLPLEKKYANNLGEWEHYFDFKASRKEIGQLFYETNDSTLALLGTATPLPQKLRNNQLAKLFKQGKYKEGFQYLRYVKQGEKLVNPKYGSWEFADKEVGKMQAHATKGRQLYKQETSDFLKLRYAFLITRLEHYQGNYTECIKAYDELVATVLNQKQVNALAAYSHIKHRALMLKAGALKRTGKEGEALYLFSKVFWESANQRELAQLNFFIREDDTWDEALKLAQNEDEKAALWMLKGLKDKRLDLTALKAMHQTNPGAKELEVLLLHEVNDLERQILSEPITLSYGESREEAEEEPQKGGVWESIKNFFSGLWQSIFGGDNTAETVVTNADLNELGKMLQFNEDEIDFIKQFKEVSTHIAQKGNTHNPALWHTVAAYMNYLLRDFDTARKILSNTQTSDPLTKRQHNIISTLLVLDEKEPITTSTEQMIAQAVKDQLPPKPNDYGETTASYYRFLIRVAQNYMLYDQIPKAILTFYAANEESVAKSLIDFYASQKELDEIVQLLEEPQGEWQNLLTKHASINADIIRDAQGTRYMREGKFEEAIKQYAKASNAHWKKYNIKKGHFDWEDNYALFTAKFEQNPLLHRVPLDTFNKVSFAKKCLDLSQKAKTNPQEADQYYYQIANGLFSSPYWGYTGSLWEGQLMVNLRGFMPYSPFMYPLNLKGISEKAVNKEKVFLNTYATRQLANVYYRKVIENTPNKELAAEAAFLARHGQLNSHSNATDTDASDLFFITKLVNDYKDTQFYENIRESCPNLDAY